MAAYEMTATELRQVQMIELELLQEVDRICKKYNIKYNIIAGTLLGSVRHKGFIPWDDDADVALLRPEYEKFREACKRELDRTRFYFQDHRNTKGYRWGYGKLRRKGTCFLRENQEGMPYKQGIFIDIFPLDACPESYPMRALQNFQCFCVRKALWSEVGKSVTKNKVIRAWYKLLNKMPRKKIFNHYAFLKRCWNGKDNKKLEKATWVRILTFPTPNKSYGYKKEWYDSSCTYEFEGKMFRGIKNADAYLSFKFGEYMQLPPLESRKTHPISKLKLVNPKK